MCVVFILYAVILSCESCLKNDVVNFDYTVLQVLELV